MKSRTSNFLRPFRSFLGLSALLLFASSSGCGASAPYSPAEPTAEEAQWMEYNDLLRQGEVKQAANGFATMCHREEPYPRACYNLARALELAGDGEGALGAAMEYVREYPEGPHGPSAAKLMARVYSDKGDPAGGAVRMQELARELRSSDVWDSLLYAAADLLRRAGDAPGERKVLETLVAGDRWSSQLWNDSMWRLVEMAGERGDPKEEERLLERFLDSRESSHIIASYNYPKHDDALLRLGRLHMARGDRERALELFMELAEWETSRMRDDGLLWAAKVKFELGRKGEACELLWRILKIEDAGSGREARRMIETLECRAQ